LACARPAHVSDYGSGSSHSENISFECWQFALNFPRNQAEAKKPTMRIILVAAALIIALWPGRADAQLFRLAVDEIQVAGTTDEIVYGCPYYPCAGGPDRQDEVYFTVAGAIGNSLIGLPEVAPTSLSGSGYYAMRAPADGGPSILRGIPLWNGQWNVLRPGETAVFIVLIRERDLTGSPASAASVISMSRTAACRAAPMFNNYTCTGTPYWDQAPNQEWILSPVGVSAISAFAILALHSGQCLDVVWASRNDQANVQSTPVILEPISSGA